MIFTRTSTPTPKKTTTKTNLTPSKRRFINEEHDIPTHSARELHSWTFSAESIAPCMIYDVLNMRKNTVDDYDFFWLGGVPCRSVKIVGMIVGIQVYERKILYSIDDGTGVIDCSQAHRIIGSASKANSKYERPVTKTVLESLKPIAEIGQTVQVIGIVRLQYESRAITVNRILVCRSPNEELLHAKLVRELHRKSYSSKDPFVIPKQSKVKPPDSSSTNGTHLSPTRMSHPPSSVSSSPVKSSPIKHDIPEVVAFSPPKLRHPSRLHTHDLTENTFRIYVKHYMDHATLPRSTTFEYDSDTTSRRYIDRTITTPTKRSRLTSTTQSTSPHHTIPSRSTVANDHVERRSHDQCSPPELEGFTISYLRSVPELSLLASRVVQAVANRHQRAERKRLKEAGITSSTKVSQSSYAATIPPEKFAGKMKRLFQWAIIQLLKEGCIVLWDGPARKLPVASSMTPVSNRLWKTKHRSEGVPADNSRFISDSTSVFHPFLDGDAYLGYISDPQPDEESYIPLTPTYLALHVEQAVKTLVEVHEEKGKPYAGATKDGILNMLKKDDRWRYVGPWSVQDALEVLKAEGKVWDMGKGKWDLTA